MDMFTNGLLPNKPILKRTLSENDVGKTQSAKKISIIKVILENKKFNSDIFDPVNVYRLQQDYNGFF
jgi:hypothetical protein